MREAAERFPDKEYYLLPTSFGNIVRAFEVYPRVMYGLDAIPGWSRLLSVIPNEYKVLVDDAKAQVDFWVNIWLFALIVLGEYFVFVLNVSQIKSIWFPAVVVCLVIISYLRARSAAVQWGNLVKAAFDVFLVDLRNKLGFPNPSDKGAEQILWHRFSQAVIYADAESLPNRYGIQE